MLNLVKTFDGEMLSLRLKTVYLRPKLIHILILGEFIMTYELFYLNRFYISPYSQSACGQPSPDFVNNPADGYRTLTTKKNYLKELNWIKTEVAVGKRIN